MKLGSDAERAVWEKSDDASLPDDFADLRRRSKLLHDVSDILNTVANAVEPLQTPITPVRINLYPASWSSMREIEGCEDFYRDLRRAQSKVSSQSRAFDAIIERRSRRGTRVWKAREAARQGRNERAADAREEARAGVLETTQAKASWAWAEKAAEAVNKRRRVRLEAIAQKIAALIPAARREVEECLKETENLGLE